MIKKLSQELKILYTLRKSGRRTNAVANCRSNYCALNGEENFTLSL